ncbi:hypothetical protein QU487_02680 [Crenobacter sp. SG2305]|uniref:2-keto-4-pentenoate hydratase n=1 Tax=Crenobacter oryzisoli TaxID=3056844 RepID=UPI0025AAF178|nr:hypothetical protein [Crenobacter sp. SG2305]MDN0081667.1 hypothetical protein [Crenobacter sp. SG2305]
MTDRANAVSAAAQILAERRLRGEQGPLLPDACRPGDFDTALAIQEAVTARLGADIAGWKCGLPAPDRLVVAPIYADTVCLDSPCSVWTRTGRARVEPELAFVFGSDLPPRQVPYTPAEVDAAIVRTHLALELIDSRYGDAAGVGFTDMLADNLVNQGLYLGPEVDAEQARAASDIVLRLDSASLSQHYEGRHPNSHPRAPLYWLVEFLRGRGQGIVAGQVVITGSYAGVIELPVAEEVSIRFGELGTLTVSFSARQ